MWEQKILFNGIDGATGDYLVEPMPIAELARRADRFLPKESLDEKDGGGTLGETEADLGEISEAGWGVIFAADAAPELRQQLQPLLDLRRQQAGRLYRELIYRVGESKRQFLARFDVGPGPVEPTRMPYYLLIVGDPQAVPFSFQYQLSVKYAVGRLTCERLKDYGNYARSVVAAESGRVFRPRRASILATDHPDDPMTADCRRLLAEPVAEALSQQQHFAIESWFGDEASKQRLRSLLGGEATPSLLLTISHALGFARGHAQQRQRQGALLCSDWQGPRAADRAVREEHFLAASDIGPSDDLHGLVSFHLGCFSAGTPKLDALDNRHRSQRRALAPNDFIARLPQRLLGHEQGGALAVIGHVDRAWGASALGGEGQRPTYEAALSRLLAGQTVGQAMDVFGERYAEISADLVAMNFEIDLYGGSLSDETIIAWWTAFHDARTYVVLGDPAVRLPVAVS